MNGIFYDLHKKTGSLKYGALKLLKKKWRGLVVDWVYSGDCIL